MLISVAIASIGRPDLFKTLSSLETVNLPPDASLEVIVGDDSTDGAVISMLENYQPQQFELTVLPVHARNIAICRNACLNAARGVWLAFIDDDEWADESWLCELINCATRQRVDAVFGKIVSYYPEKTPQWLANADPVGALRARPEGAVQTGSTGNAMVKRQTVIDHGISFNEDFGRTGGEDTDFFLRLRAKGARFFYTSAAIVRENVPPAKADVSFIKVRALRSGQTYARLTLRDKSAVSGIVFFLTAMLKASSCFIIAYAMRPFNRSTSFIFELKALMNLAKLREVMGADLPEIYNSAALDVRSNEKAGS